MSRSPAHDPSMRHVLKLRQKLEHESGIPRHFLTAARRRLSIRPLASNPGHNSCNDGMILIVDDNLSSADTMELALDGSRRLRDLLGDERRACLEASSRDSKGTPGPAVTDLPQLPASGRIIDTVLIARYPRRARPLHAPGPFFVVSATTDPGRAPARSRSRRQRVISLTMVPNATTSTTGATSDSGEAEKSATYS